MSTKFTKEELRTPDQVTKTLRQGFVWTTKHSNIVLVAIGLFIALGILLSALSYFSEQKEIAQQEKYFLLEKSYVDAKRGFDEGARSEKAKKASGDLDKDYGSIVAGLESFISEDGKTKASQMAALNLSEIYLNYKKDDQALAALQKVENHLDKSDMITGLVWMQMGNILANKNDCQGAIGKWETLVKNKAQAFGHDEAKLRMGLCYESMGDLAKAEELYQDVGKKEETTDFAASREAQKYLRLLKAKKNL